MDATADVLEGFADKLQHYIDNTEQANLEIRRITAHVGEHFEGSLATRFEEVFSSEIHANLILLTGDLRHMHTGLRENIDYVRRITAKGVDI